MSDLALLGVPFNSDGTPPDAEHPPQHLRHAGLLDRLAASRAVRDCGDLPVPVAEGVRDASTGILNWSSWQTVTRHLARSVRALLSSGDWPLVIGGDCSILVGILAGAASIHGRCGLFFVDGHGDFHTPTTSASGEPADMELAVVTGRAPSPEVTRGKPLIADEDVLVFGIRERDGIDDTPIRVVDYSRLGVGDLVTTVRQAAEELANVPVWLHLDVDVIDPQLMPVIFPAGPGITFDQAATLLHTLLEARRVIGMDVACFHPALDRSGMATINLVDLLSQVMAR